MPQHVASFDTTNRSRSSSAAKVTFTSKRPRTIWFIALVYSEIKGNLPFKSLGNKSNTAQLSPEQAVESAAGRAMPPSLTLTPGR